MTNPTVLCILTTGRPYTVMHLPYSVVCFRDQGPGVYAVGSPVPPLADVLGPEWASSECLRGSLSREELGCGCLGGRHVLVARPLPVPWGGCLSSQM